MPDEVLPVAETAPPTGNKPGGIGIEELFIGLGPDMAAVED